MRRLTIMVASLALIYGGYWFVGARALQQSVEAQVVTMRDAGWTLDHSDLTVAGFPSRFETAVTEVSIASPDASLRYAAPLIQTYALSYQPNRAILVFPPSQEVMVAGQPIAVQSTGLRASVTVSASTALPLDEVIAEAESLSLAHPGWGTTTLTSLLVALRAAEAAPNSYDMYVNAQDVVIPDQISALLPPDAQLPAAFDVVTADVTAILDRSLNRHTLPDWPDNPGRLRGLTLRDLTIRLGDLSLKGDGALTIDSTGVPDGTITLRITDWQRILDLALQAGIVPGDLRFIATTVGQTLSQGDADLTLPITFLNGNASVGPIPLGPAPRFF